MGSRFNWWKQWVQGKEIGKGDYLTIWKRRFLGKSKQSLMAPLKKT
jgi:hypothetical protein